MECECAAATYIPMRWEDRDVDRFAIAHLRDAIAFVEQHTGKKYDWDAARKVLERHNDEVRNELEKWNYMATDYCPLGLTASSLFHAYYFTFSGGRDKNVMKAEKKVMKLIEEAYENKTNCFPKARHRAILWGGPACYWLQFANWLYNCWGILVVAQMDNFSGNVIIDTTSEDSMLDGIARNYETGIMRRHLTGGWQHTVEFWEEAEKFHCDMVIMNDDITCKGALGLTGVIMDQAREKNIAFTMVSNDMFDHRTISRQDMRKEINDFMITVMQEEPLDASLMEFDDSKGW